MCYFERWSQERILKSLCSFTLARSALLSLTSRLQTKGPNQDSQEDQTGVFEADILKAFQLAADYSYALVPCALQLAVDHFNALHSLCTTAYSTWLVSRLFPCSFPMHLTMNIQMKNLYITCTYLAHILIIYCYKAAFRNI